MTQAISPESLKLELVAEIDAATQQETGKDVDVLIAEIAKTNFEHLSEEHKLDKIDKSNITKIKYSFTISSIVLAVVAVVAAIATILFSTGIFTPGTVTLAIVTGFVGISTSFNQLDSAIARYINFHKEEKQTSNRIDKLAKKIDAVKKLIGTRIDKIQYIDGEVRTKRAFEILSQVKKVNEFVKLIKKEIPAKITAFTVLDPSPLLKYVPQTT